MSKRNKKPFFCKIGLHAWKFTGEAKYENFIAEKIGLPYQPATRECGKCGKKQWLDIHCLGLNPPAYVKTWIDEE